MTGTTNTRCVFLGMIAVCLGGVLAATSGAARELPPPPPNAVTLTTAHGTTLTIDPDRFHVYDVPDDRFEEITGIPLKWQTPEKTLGELRRPQTKSAVDSGRVLTLLVQWVNHQAFAFAHPREAYDSILYSDGIYPTGSVRDYYQEVSYGAFDITGDVAGWEFMPTLYEPTIFGYPYDMEEIVSVFDPFVNFADYDGDGDGFVDALWLIHAGPGAEETHDQWDIWSHAVLGAYVPTSDGVAIDRWSVQPERHANGDLVGIRVFCHEYAHILNLPDLYDYDAKLDTITYFTPNDANDHPLVDWDVMGYAGYAIMAYGNRTCPSHFSAWSRIFLGWATPTVPPCLDGTYDLYNVEEYSTNNIFKVPITDDGTEYYYLEYRNPRSSALFDHVNSDFSAYCPWFTPGGDTLDAGLLITHIDEKVTPNNGIPWQPNYAVTVVDAGYDPSQPWDGTEFTEWWYPYEFRIASLYSTEDPGQTTFSPSTTPSSDGYTGPSDVTITVLAQNSDYITLEINKLMAPALAAGGPVTLEEVAALEILVSATDPNCTTPGLVATSLPSYATFFDSNNTRGVLTLSPQIGDAGVDTAVIAALWSGPSPEIAIEITVTPASCACPCHGDPTCDGEVNVFDVVKAVGVAFREETPVRDPICPIDQTDVDCSGATDVLDVVRFVNVGFRNEDPALQFCDGCTP